MEEYTNIRLEPSENGFILSYTEQEKQGNHPMSNTTYKPCTRVYKVNEGKQALADMIKMYKGEESDNDTNK